MIRYSFLVLSLLLLIGDQQTFAQQKSVKRGIAYGSHSEADAEALSKGVTWWYNWFHQPEGGIYNSYKDFGFDYVPMAWNGAFNKENLRNFLLTHPEVKYILGWNEPNFTDQANMKPSDAAAQWKDIESIADEFDLEIVGPAVNFCGNCVQENGVTYTDPVEYLDDFFDACVGCRVDYIAVHCYMGNLSALEWYISLFKKYGKRIWLTEFANWENNPTLEEQKKFLVDAVSYLEKDPDVVRYAWFTGRHSGAPYIGLLENGQPGKLTELGDIYVNMPSFDSTFVHSVPSRIEAEYFNTMNGVFVEPTNDDSGYTNLGYIESNDWMEYQIVVAETKQYYLNLRISTINTSSLKIYVDDDFIKTVDLPSTGGWQNWQTVIDEIEMSEGVHTLRFIAAGRFNINWFELVNELITETEVESFARESDMIYPNPVKDILHLKAEPGFLRLEITDLAGHKFIGRNADHTIDVSDLPNGFYILRLHTKSGIVLRRKILKIS